MILVTSPFNWHHAVTVTYFKDKVVTGRGPQFPEFACDTGTSGINIHCLSGSDTYIHVVVLIYC